MQRPTLWIIDGNNVMRRDPSLAAIVEGTGIEAAERELLARLTRFRGRKGRGHSVVVAFDGVAGEPRRNVKGLRVIHPRRGVDADRLVLEEARRAEGRMDVHVVSSDRKDIAQRLRGLRVSVHSVEEFRSMLSPRRGSGRDAGAEEAEKPAPPKGADLDHWLREFGEEE